MLITGDDLDYNIFVKARLREQFHMSELGSLSYFLGIEVTSSPEGTISPSESTFRISLTVRALLITVLWTPP